MRMYLIKVLYTKQERKNEQIILYLFRLSVFIQAIWSGAGMDRTPGPVTVPVQKFAILFRSGRK